MEDGKEMKAEESGVSWGRSRKRLVARLRTQSKCSCWGFCYKKRLPLFSQGSLLLAQCCNNLRDHANPSISKPPFPEQKLWEILAGIKWSLPQKSTPAYSCDMCNIMALYQQYLSMPFEKISCIRGHIQMHTTWKTVITKVTAVESPLMDWPFPSELFYLQAMFFLQLLFKE